MILICCSTLTYFSNNHILFVGMRCLHTKFPAIFAVSLASGSLCSCILTELSTSTIDPPIGQIRGAVLYCVMFMHMFASYSLCRPLISGQLVLNQQDHQTVLLVMCHCTKYHPQKVIRWAPAQAAPGLQRARRNVDLNITRCATPYR